MLVLRQEREQAVIRMLADAPRRGGTRGFARSRIAENAEEDRRIGGVVAGEIIRFEIGSAPRLR
jgi:hypothetical protein